MGERVFQFECIYGLHCFIAFYDRLLVHENYDKGVVFDVVVCAIVVSCCRERDLLCLGS